MSVIVVKHKRQLGIGVSVDRLHVVIDTADTSYEYEEHENIPESYSSISIQIEDVPALIEALKNTYEKVKHLPNLDDEERHTFNL